MTGVPLALHTRISPVTLSIAIEVSMKKRLILLVVLAVSLSNSLHAIASKKDAREFNTKGYRLYKNKEYKQAIVWFKKSHFEDPEYLHPIYNLACSYALLEDSKGAIEWLMKYSMLNPKSWEKIYDDEDFDKIRRTRPFLNFMESYKTKIPQITSRKDDHSFVGFPAISSDGDFILIAHEESWYDDTIDFHVKKYKRQSKKLLKIIQIRKGEWCENDPANVKTKIKEARDEAQRGQYRPLEGIMLSNYSGYYSLDRSEENCIVILNSKKKLKKKICFPTNSYQDGACMIAPPKNIEECTVVRSAQIERVWVSNKYKVAVIQYGYYAGRDGEEVGPMYKVVNLF